MLVPAASAFAETVTVTIAGTGGGEISSAEGLHAFESSYPPVYVGEPPIECGYASPGPQTGTCENEAEDLGEGISGDALWATPAPGSKFAGWKVTGGMQFGTFIPGCFKDHSETTFENRWRSCLAYTETGSGSNVQVTATFDVKTPPNLKLNVEEGSGTVISNPAGLECTASAPESCEGEVAEGKVILTASPAPGYLVKSWKGCDVGGVNGRQCTVTAGSSLKEVGVKFVKVFSLAGSKSGGLGIMSTAPGGINCGYACTSSTALFKEGALTVKAKPAKHFHFVEFKGGTGSAASCNGVTSPECTIASFNSNSVINEVYAEDAKNTLSFQKGGGGQGFIKTKPTNINCGLTCTFAQAEFYTSEEPEVTVTLGKGTTQVTWISPTGTCTGHVLVCKIPMSSTNAVPVEFN